jgi:hypothetical protein
MERRRSSLQHVGEFIVKKAGFFLRAERAGQKNLRKFSWLQKFMCVLLPALLVCAYLVPHLMTGKKSLLGAGDVCRERSILRYIGMNDIDADEAVELHDSDAGALTYCIHRMSLMRCRLSSPQCVSCCGHSSLRIMPHLHLFSTNYVRSHALCIHSSSAS